MSDLDYRKLLDAFGDAVVIGDRSGSIVYANPAVGKLLGWTREELLGSPLTLVIPHKLRSRHTAGFNRARSTRQHRVLGQVLRVPVLRPNGTELPLDMVLSAFRGGAGEELFIATFRGVASPVKAEATPRYLHGLAALAEQLRVVEDPAALARRLEILASAHLGACGVRLWLASSPDELRLVNRHSVPDLGEPANGVMSPSTASTPPAEAARTGRLHLGKEDGPGRKWLDHHGIAATLALPLLDGDELLGVIHFLSGDSWSEDLSQALSLLGGLVVSSLRESRRRKQAPRQASAAALGEALSDVSGRLAALAPDEDIDPLLESLVEWGICLTGADQGGLVLRDPSSDNWVVRACAGYKISIAGLLVPEGAGVTALAQQRSQAVVVPDYQQLENALPRIRQRGVRAALGVPVKGPERLLGVLTLGTKRRDKQFTEEDVRRTQALAGIASLAIQRAHPRT
jgi:PAS domain S-box-containing protein